MNTSPLIEYDKLPHLPLLDSTVKALISKTGQTEPHFFRVLVAYFFSLISANMHVSVRTPDRGDLPINLFAINLASSGFGKGHSVSILSESVMKPFMDMFMNNTLPIVIDARKNELAAKRSRISGESIEEEMINVERDFASTGPYLPVFDSGTSPAFKQLRTQLLMSQIGCLNMRTDELGTNLSSIQEILTAFIESFDIGIINPKLVKHTKENERLQYNSGRIPPMWLGFGTPTKLLDGGRTESEFMEHLETGFARRCFFGYCTDDGHITDMTAEEIYDVRTSTQTDEFLSKLGQRLKACASVQHHKAVINVPKDISIQLINYELHNRRLVKNIPEQETILRAELLHRHSKVLKLAGAFAFVTGQSQVTEDILNSAIRLGEDSGHHFKHIMRREPDYVRLAKYIGTAGRQLTLAELMQRVPYYKGTASTRNSMMDLAISYGVKNNITISRKFVAGVEYVSGEMLVETDPARMDFSYSADPTTGFREGKAAFDKLHKLVLKDGLYWTAHHFKQGHRHKDNMVRGFNLLVLDVDDGMSIETARLLLQEYTYLIHTTKSHGLSKNNSGDPIDKFRVIIPLSHTLRLDADDYLKFMENVFDVLPFAVDAQTKNVSRAWTTHKGEYWYNEGKFWDVLPYIPDTTTAEEKQAEISKLYSLTNTERWFIANTASGNRNGQLLRYGYMLIDTNVDYNDIRKQVVDLNARLPEPLSEEELDRTLLRTLYKKAIERDAKP